jgi:hypothetical protein
MNETKYIKVRDRDGAAADCTVEILSIHPARLVFSGPFLDGREFLANDVFDALVSLRGSLEEIGARLLCAGARPEVFPSGMSRDMGGGIKAYVNRIGMPAGKPDIVDIFDYAGPELVGSVAEQNAFHKKWVESLRQR